jgi:hypothetical protein
MPLDLQDTLYYFCKVITALSKSVTVLSRINFGVDHGLLLDILRKLELTNDWQTCVHKKLK